MKYFVRFVFLLSALVSLPVDAKSEKPNILFIVTDDHAVQALGSGPNDSPVPLPQLHKLASEGMVFDRSFCTNSICGPSRASILTGRHSHKNGYVFNGQKPFDGKQPTYPKMLQKAGYQTGYFGKWHLDSNPTGFDQWEILPNQGSYYQPDFIVLGEDGKRKTVRVPGYATDVITDKAIHWMEQRDPSKPFALVVGHKAPHRAWAPALRHLGKVDVTKLKRPTNLHDNYENRPEFLKKNQQTIASHMAIYSDLKVFKDLIPKEMQKEIESAGYGWDFGEFHRMTPEEQAEWKTYYTQRTENLLAGMKSGELKDAKAFTEWKWRVYMEDYLGCLLAVDESVGKLMAYLKKEGIADNTLVFYCGDQSFYLGEHGMYDKRWIFEESLRMPLIMKWPAKIKAGVRSEALVQNIDYAPTICVAAGVNQPENMESFQGEPLQALFATGKAPDDWRKVLYYCFYENPGEHNAPRHDGIRTDRYTLAQIWTSGEWMLFDNLKDPKQMQNVYNHPHYAKVSKDLIEQYKAVRTKYEVPEGSPGKGGPKPHFTPSW